MFVRNIVLIKNLFVVSIFYEFPEHHMGKNVLPICISYQKPRPYSPLSKILTKSLRKGCESNKLFLQKALQYICFEMGCLQIE